MIQHLVYVKYDEILDFDVFLLSTENGKRRIMDSVAALKLMVFYSIFPFIIIRLLQSTISLHVNS